MNEKIKTICLIFALFGYVAFGNFVFGENCFDAFIMGSFFGAGITVYYYLRLDIKEPKQ